MKAVILAVCALALATPPAHGRVKRPTCVPQHASLPRSIDGEGFAVDGDTIVLLVDGERYGEVRLFGIDAPELRSRASKEETEAGLRSREALDRLLAASGDRVRVIPIEHDAYCRIVGRVEVDGRDASEAMLRGGWAYLFTTWAFRRPGEAGRARTYLAIQREARDAGAGLWSRWLGTR